MRIERVRIENFRSIKTADFEPGVLCGLIGPNNAGKSNVIKALALVLGDTWPSARAIDDADFYGLAKDSDIIINVWFDEMRETRGDVGDAVPYNGIQFRATRYKRRSGTNEPGDVRTEFVCIDEGGEPVLVLKRPRPTSQPYPTAAVVTTEIREALPAVVVDVDRNARMHLSGSARSVFGRLVMDVSRQLRKDAAAYARFTERFAALQDALHTEEFEALQQAVESQLRLHTGLEDVGVQLDGLDPVNLYRNFSVLFRDDSSPSAVGVERMGTGVQSAMVVAMLQVYRELKREHAVLLFEEPELFLHPHGRRHLFGQLRALAESGVQIIYTTHSQDFLSLERIDTVRLVHKTLADGTRVEKPMLELLEGVDWQKRAKHLSAPKNELFFARSVVLVEGRTEELAIQHLARKMEPPLDLDRLGCSVLGVESKTALPICIRIGAALGKRVLALYDTDSGATEADDIATNAKRKQELEEACTNGGELLSVDPCFDAVAGVPSQKRGKVDRMHEYLEGAESWAALPEGLRALMQRVADFASESAAQQGKKPERCELAGGENARPKC